MADLTEADVRALLDHLRLTTYQPSFADAEVTGLILDVVEEPQDLADLGITMKSVHLKILMKSLAAYRTNGVPLRHLGQ